MSFPHCPGHSSLRTGFAGFSGNPLLPSCTYKQCASTHIHSHCVFCTCGSPSILSFICPCGISPDDVPPGRWPADGLWRVAVPASLRLHCHFTWCEQTDRVNPREQSGGVPLLLVVLPVSLLGACAHRLPDTVWGLCPPDGQNGLCFPLICHLPLPLPLLLAGFNWSWVRKVAAEPADLGF